MQYNYVIKPLAVRKVRSFYRDDRRHVPDIVDWPDCRDDRGAMSGNWHLTQSIRLLKKLMLLTIAPTCWGNDVC